MSTRITHTTPGWGRLWRQEALSADRRRRIGYASKHSNAAFFDTLKRPRRGLGDWIRLHIRAPAHAFFKFQNFVYPGNTPVIVARNTVGRKY